MKVERTSVCGKDALAGAGDGKSVTIADHNVGGGRREEKRVRLPESEDM